MSEPIPPGEAIAIKGAKEVKPQRAPATITPLDLARADSMRADTKSRGRMVVIVCVIFFLLNAAVMWLIYYAFAQDSVRMAAQPPMPASDRIVTANVLMSLIGATAVQTGVGFIAIVSYLFPKQGR